MSEKTILDLTFDNHPVTLRDKEGKETDYTIREMIAADRDLFLNGFRSRFEMDENGKPKFIKNYINLQGELLGLCLFDVDGKKVPVSVIQSWPSHVVHTLYQKAQVLNQVEEAPTETVNAAKKE